MYTVSAIERLLYEYRDIPERKRELLIKMGETQTFKLNAEDTLKSAVYSHVPKVKEIQDSVYEAVQKITDEFDIHLTYYKNEIERINAEEKAMYEALKALDQYEHKIIEMRYLKNYRWESIVIKIPYERTQCFKIRDEALQKISENYNTD